MTPTAPVEQALFTLEHGQLMERGASAGLETLATWRSDAHRLLRGIGEPPSGAACTGAVFANPFGPAHVAVVQVENSPGGGLLFRMLIVPRGVYRDSIRDPFAVAERFPPDWSARGSLPTLGWPLDPPPWRRVEQLQKVLETGGSPTLLGAVQALVDGGRVVFERAAPAPALVRDIWTLLPEAARAELWPASFAFANDLLFDLLVVPKIEPGQFDRYVTEEQAIEYPEGTYEFSLQYAIEHGDQREVDRLLARRSSKHMLRFVIAILVLGTLAYLGIHYLLNVF